MSVLTRIRHALRRVVMTSNETGSDALMSDDGMKMASRQVEASRVLMLEEEELTEQAPPKDDGLADAG